MSSTSSATSSKNSPKNSSGSSLIARRLGQRRPHLVLEHGDVGGGQVAQPLTHAARHRQHRRAHATQHVRPFALGVARSISSPRSRLVLERVGIGHLASQPGALGGQAGNRIDAAAAAGDFAQVAAVAAIDGPISYWPGARRTQMPRRVKSRTVSVETPSNCASFSAVAVGAFQPTTTTPLGNFAASEMPRSRYPYRFGARKEDPSVQRVRW